MKQKQDLESKYQFCQDALNRIGKELDIIAQSNLAGAVAAYPGEFSDPELQQRHESLTRKHDEIQKRMLELQALIVTVGRR